MIFARSPYIVTIDETGQESTRLELFIWNGTGSAPAFPSYSLSKQVPSINNINTYYNISPFLREYFDFNQSNPTVSGTDDLTNEYAYCNVTYKTYYSIDGIETLIDTFTDKCFDGYALYENGSNYSGQNVLLSDKSLAGGSNVYNYPCCDSIDGDCEVIYVSFIYDGVFYGYELPLRDPAFYELAIEVDGEQIGNIYVAFLEVEVWRLSITFEDPNYPSANYFHDFTGTFCPKFDDWEFANGDELESVSTKGSLACSQKAAGFSLLTGQAGDNNYWIAKYTDVKTLNVFQLSLDTNTVYDIAKVHPPFTDFGNKVEILDGDEVVQDTYYFLPQCECKYEVITCDFVNRWGGWQREFFYKASTESVEMSNTQYKLNPTNFPNYNLYEGQTKNFNTNAKRSIKVNTGWVEENYKVTIEEMLLSETIRINGLPAVLKTKSVEKFKSINTKTINYQMEFEMAYDVLNTII
jgi:hypothetical protein